MTTPPDPPPNPGHPVPQTVTGLLNDLRPSIHDPTADLLMPSGLQLGEWLDETSRDELLLATIAEQSLDHATKSAAHLRSATAKQRALERLGELTQAVQAVRRNEASAERPKRPAAKRDEALNGRAPRSLDSFREVKRSLQWFEGLRRRLLNSSLRDDVDMRVAWFKVHDQGRNSSCVGHAVADLIERQRRSAFDPPSARYIWSAAKELDDDDRPTTMIAGAGTSLRAGMSVVTRFGYATESEISTTNNDLYRGELDDFYARLLRRRAEAVVNLGQDTKMWLAWLNSGRPIAACIEVGDAYLATGTDMVMKPDTVARNNFPHAVLLMGYRFVMERKNGSTVRDLFRRHLSEGELNDEELPVEYLVRSSAGTRWGNQGYAWMPQSMINQLQEGYGLIWKEEEPNG